ncbi:hypothetical protein K525DRAFT_246801, partial [Schizophyllum commune Loenen D]
CLVTMRSSVVLYVVLIAALHLKLHHWPSKHEVEVPRRIQRKHIIKTSSSMHSTPLEAASAQLLTKSERIEGDGASLPSRHPPLPHNLKIGGNSTYALAGRRTGMLDLCKVGTRVRLKDAPPHQTTQEESGRYSARVGWGGGGGGGGGFSPLITWDMRKIASY